jgi:hypothetical protein
VFFEFSAFFAEALYARPMRGTKREHACKMCDWFCARSPIKWGNSMTEEENGIIVDANFSTPSSSKKSLAVLEDFARPGASLKWTGGLAR